MDKKKKIGLYIVFVLLLCIVVGAASYAYIVARTDEKNVSNDSGKVLSKKNIVLQDLILLL